jgi:HTH-type transcriptional regulator/antitoxin HigA
MTKKYWFLLETEQQYKEAAARYETIKNATAEEEHHEKLLLVHLIANYEEKNWDLPEVDSVETIKIRMRDFGYKAAD